MNLPWKCKHCDGQYMTLDTFFEHIKITHKQRVVTDKQLESYKRRRKEAEEKTANKTSSYNPFAAQLHDR